MQSPHCFILQVQPPYPPFLTQVIAPLNSPSVSEIFFICDEAGAVYDTAKDEADPLVSASLKYILPFIWAANLDKIHPNPHIH